MRKGEKALSQANYSEAIASCQKAIQLNGRSADAHICLANALMGSTLPGMPDIEVLQQARKEEQIALELAPNNAEALAGLGELEYRLGFGPGPTMFKRSAGLKTAKDLLARALASDPNNYHAHNELARIAGGEVSVTIMQAFYAAGFKPGEKNQFSPAAKERLRQQCGSVLEEGIEHAQKAISIRANAYQAMHELGGLFFFRSIIDEKESDTRADLKAQEEWNTKSQRAYAKSQRETAASDSPQPAVEPRNLQEAMAEGRKAFAAFRYENAVHAFERAVQFNEQSADAHVQLANALLWTSAGENSIYPFDDERLQRAVKEDHRTLELTPGNAEAMAGLAKAAYSFAMRSQGSEQAARFAEAKDWARKALIADPNNFHANYLMAHLAYQEFGRASFDAASEAYKKGFHDFRLPPQYREPLQQRYSGLVEEGLRCAQKALAIQPGSYLAMYELSNLYSARNELSANPSKTDAELAKQWGDKARQLVRKDDPDGEILRISPAPPPPPPPL
ncbi:MAG: hypothetical protein JOY85_22360 [Acidobacteriaceae bacterium]|nr:hypothetical protein [Acidobacteriaceae bacterium]